MDMHNSIWKLLADLENKKGITEVIINNPSHVYIEREGKLIRLNVQIHEQDFVPFCEDIAKLNSAEFDPNNPILDGVLEDGSRVNIISSVYTNTTPAITIRKYLHEINKLDDLNGKFGLSDNWILFLKALVKSKMNIIVSGGTGVGKTTFLNLLLQEISTQERVITVEDTRELNFKIPNTVSLIASNNISKVEKPLTMRDLIKNTLRMRPDRIIIGEVRGAEAFDLLQSMNTGHDGSMCTVHASSSAEALTRIENLFLYAGIEIPIRAIRHQMSSAIDFIIQLGRDRDGKRIVTKITEVSNMEGDVILLQDIGVQGDKGPAFSGLVPKRINDLFDNGDLDRKFFINL
jgi:pilus assembly protein CpaF